MPEQLHQRHGSCISVYFVPRRRAAHALIVEGFAMTLGTILLIVLILILVGIVPSWPHSRGWGYGPSGGVGLLVVIVIVLLLMGRL